MNDPNGNQTVLLLVDIQNDYFPGGAYEVPGSSAAATVAASLLSKFRQQRDPVVHVRHIAEKPDSTFFLPNTPGAELHAFVQPGPKEPVIIKHYPNSFRATNLLEVLRELGAKQLVITGMMTHMCIDATTRAACDLGFECTVVADACAAPGQTHDGVKVPAEQVQAAFLSALSGSYAQVVKAADLL